MPHASQMEDFRPRNLATGPACLSDHIYCWMPSFHTTSGGSDERSKNHQRRDELLSAWRYIPANWSLWCSTTEYLDLSVLTRTCIYNNTHLQEAWHCLQATDDTKVNTILKWAHRHQCACQQALPMGCHSLLLLTFHGGLCYSMWNGGVAKTRLELPRSYENLEK